MLVQFRTGYLEQGLVVADSKKLSRKYMFSRQMLFDLIALIPLEYLFIEGHHPLLGFTKLFKTHRVLKFYYMIESRTIYPNFIRVLGLTHVLLLSCHWWACFYYLIAKQSSFKTGWSIWKNLHEAYNVSVAERHLSSLYWSTLTLTTIGIQMLPETIYEYMFTILSYLIGVFAFATIVGQVGSVITNRNASRLEYERLLDGVKQYMQLHGVPKQMQRRVLRWYDYSWSRGRMCGGWAQSLAVLPDKLKTELALHVNLETLKKVWANFFFLNLVSNFDQQQNY